MDLVVENLAKRFGYEWIFEKLTFHFESGNCYALTGPNGSGKSTLLQILSGSLTASKGSIVYTHQNQQISDEHIYKYVGITAPYLELIEEFSLVELLDFHFQFKKPLLSKKEIIDFMYLNDSKNKYLKQYSSGMKQRVKLGLAVLSDCPLLLLDEPTTNLDQQGIDWYKNLIETYQNGRTIVIASNQAHEYDFCNKGLDMLDYKDG